MLAHIESRRSVPSIKVLCCPATKCIATRSAKRFGSRPTLATGQACDRRLPNKIISEAASTTDMSSTHPPPASNKKNAVIDRSILLLRTLSGLKYGASTPDLARVGVMHAFDHDAHMAMLGVAELRLYP
jgi:hypothetical protein